MNSKIRWSAFMLFLIGNFLLIYLFREKSYPILACQVFYYGFFYYFLLGLDKEKESVEE